MAQPPLRGLSRSRERGTAKRWRGHAALTALAAALLACACSPAKPDKAADAAPLSRDMDAVFQLAFGSLAPSPREIERKGKKVDIEYSPSHIQDLGDGRIALISTGVSPDGCSPCARAVAITYLARTGASYRVTNQWLDLGAIGNLGEKPDARFREDLFEKPALDIEMPNENQGCNEVTGTLYELLPTGPALRAAGISTHRSNVAMGGIRVGLQVDDYGDILADQKGKRFIVRYRGTYPGEVPYAPGGADGLWLPQNGFKIPVC